MKNYKNTFLIISIILVFITTLCPGDGKIAGNYLDKIAHFIIFFILSISICFKYNKIEHLINGLFLGILLGLMTEVIQQFIPGRNMDIYDGIADTLGIIAGYYIYIYSIFHFTKWNESNSIKVNKEMKRK